LSWYAAVQPFSFLPLFFWEKKNGAMSFSERKISAVFYNKIKQCGTEN